MTTAHVEAEKRGRLAELWAALWLLIRGYRVIGWRVKTPVGEIDLVAKRSGVIVFVEVKQRKTVGAAKAAIGYRQRERILRAADWWKLKTNRHDARCRFDAICIASSGWMEHIKGAWEARH